MILRYGRDVICTKITYGRVFFLAVLLLVLFCGNGWAACERWASGISLGTGGSCGCHADGNSCLGTLTCCQWNWHNGCPATATRQYYGSTVYLADVCERGGNYSTSCVYYLQCDTQCEADSVACIGKGGDWHWLGCEQGCVENTLDSSSCEPYREECERYGGTFVGHLDANSPTGCQSFCNMCTSEGQERYRRSRAVICCRKGQVPPTEITSCHNLELDGDPQMSFSSFDCNNRGGYDCECEDLSIDNASVYNSVCNDNQWPDDGSSDSEPGSQSSSSEESPSDSTGDWEYDYRDSLHRIIKYDSITMENTGAILACLLQPVSCGAFQGDTVIVNASDSTYIKRVGEKVDNVDSSLQRLGTKIDGQTSLLDTSIQNSSSRLQDGMERSLSRANDSLIDSIRKYLNNLNYRSDIQNMDSSNQYWQGKNYGELVKLNNGIDSLGGNIAGAIDSAWGNGTAPSDTVGDGPYDGFDGGSDSVGNNYLTTLGGLLDSAINDTVFGTIFAPGNDTTNWDSSARLPSLDSMKAHLDSSIVTQRSEVEDSLQAAFDTLKDEFMLLNYDSLILAPLGMRVPNSNTCPEHCFTFQIEGGEGNMAWMGDVGALEFGLCKPLPGFSFDVLYLIRIIGRMFTAVFCIYIGLWFIAGRKQ